MDRLKNRFSHWVLDPRTTSGFILTCATLVVVNVVAYHLLGRLRVAGAEVEHAHEVLQGIVRVLDDLRDAETAQRGFLLTGESKYLQPYEQAMRELEPALTALRADPGLHRAWRDHLDRLTVLITAKKADLSQTIRLCQEKGAPAALQWVRGGEGKHAMDEIRRLAETEIEVANGFLRQSCSRTQAIARNLYAGVVVANVLALILLGGTVLLVNRAATRQKEVAVALWEGKEELENRILQRTAMLSHVNEVLQTEVAERRRSEERASRLATLVESSEDAILGLGLQGQITTWNRGAERLYGYKSAEVVERPATVLLSDGSDEIKWLLERVLQGESVAAVETVQVRKDGKAVPVFLSVSPLRSRSGPEVVGAAWVARDITERRKLEAQLRQAAKMEAVGRLAAGVAHDFNNLLTVILGASELLLASMSATAPERGIVEEIARVGERSATLTRQLLAFSRQQPLESRPADLNVLVAGMAQMLTRLLGSDICLNVSLAAEPQTIVADAGQIEQVILNLAVNARDAMPEGGKLTLETREVALDETYTRTHEGLSPGPYVLLAVSDTGCGMTEDVRAHLFEPFFTTKEKGKGTGLGLATVYGIVKQSGGHLGVYSEPGQGTTFKVYLPRRNGRP